MSKTAKAGSHTTSHEAGARTVPGGDDLRTAYEIHTLAHMVYSQLQTTHHWMNASPPSVGFPQQTATPVWSWPQVWRY